MRNEEKEKEKVSNFTFLYTKKITKHRNDYNEEIKKFENAFGDSKNAFDPNVNNVSSDSDPFDIEV